MSNAVGKVPTCWNCREPITQVFCRRCGHEAVSTPDTCGCTPCVGVRAVRSIREAHERELAIRRGQSVQDRLL